MGHSADKPRREKRKIKKPKSLEAKADRGAEVIQHMGQHTATQPSYDKELS
ncbi:MAG: hypothetical protein ACRDFS_12355 [Chloroflexota bacterium]